jgi:3-(methylthio)propionyl---CoA ligase
MLGLMQDAPLLTSQTLAYAARVFPDAEIVTADNGGIVHRTTYRAADARARRLAASLKQLERIWIIPVHSRMQ